MDVEQMSALHEVLDFTSENIFTIKFIMLT